LGITFIETSAKENINVDEVFSSITKNLTNTVDKVDKEKKAEKNPRRINVNSNDKYLRKKRKRSWI